MLTQVLDCEREALHSIKIYVLIYIHNLTHLFFNVVATFPSHVMHKLPSYNLNFHWYHTVTFTHIKLVTLSLVESPL
jgi:hypothetical protein